MDEVLDKHRIEVLRAAGYSGMTKSVFSMLKNPDKYAARLVPRAVKLLQLAFPNETPVGESPRDPEKPIPDPTVRCKIPIARKAQLLQALKEDGYDEIQSGLAYIIEMYLIRRKHGEESLQQTG